MAKQEFRRFRELLNRAIGDWTQAKFAVEAHISPEHLNRMLNARTINRPSKSTLHKIATHAQNGVVYKMLEDALNAEDENYKTRTTEEILQEAKIKEAQRDFQTPFEEQADTTFRHLNEYIENDENHYHVNELTEYMAGITANVHRLHPNNLKISYQIDEPHENIHKYHDSDMYASVTITVAGLFKSAMSDLVIYFDKVSNHCLVKKASMALVDIMNLFGMPPFVLDEFEKDGVENALEQACSLPYYCHVIEPDENYSKEGVKNVLALIMGEKTEYPETIPGIGFELKEIPEAFKDFVSDHLYQVLEPWDDDPETYGNMVHDIPGLLNDSEKLAKYFDDMEYLDVETLETGWQAVISTVMSAETGLPFEFHKNTVPEETKNHKDYAYPLSPYPVILMRKSELNHTFVRHKTLLNTICRFAKMLGLERFGNLMFHHIKIDNYITNDMYVVKYDEANTDRQLPNYDGIARSDEEFLDFPEHKPDKTGIYWIMLKDGRDMTAMYIPGHNAWVKFHREWSDMIKSYHPVPVKTNDDENEENT